MKITDNSVKKSNTFGDVEVGEVFKSSNHQYFIKTETVINRDYYYDEYGYLIDWNKKSFNALNLSTGTMATFHNASEIIPVDSELLIK